MSDTQDKSSQALLGELVQRLVRDYSDDLWDDSTRQLLDIATKHLGWPPIVWQLDHAVIQFDHCITVSKESV
jgi:hypothetical protein